MTEFNKTQETVEAVAVGDVVAINWQDTRDSKVHTLLEMKDVENRFTVEAIEGGFANLEGLTFAVKTIDLIPISRIVNARQF